MDFVGNVKRVIESIEKAKELGASYRIGPELEITGCVISFMKPIHHTHCHYTLHALHATNTR